MPHLVCASLLKFLKSFLSIDYTTLFYVDCNLFLCSSPPGNILHGHPLIFLTLGGLQLPYYQELFVFIRTLILAKTFLPFLQSFPYDSIHPLISVYLRTLSLTCL